MGEEGAVGGCWKEVRLYRCSALIQHESQVLRQESVAHLSEEVEKKKKTQRSRRSSVQQAFNKPLNVAAEKKKAPSAHDFSFSLCGKINKYNSA